MPFLRSPMRRLSPVTNREICPQWDHKCERTWGVTLGSHQQEALQGGHPVSQGQAAAQISIQGLALT